MRNYEIDQYSKTSRFYQFDPRVKLVCTVALIVVIAFLRELLPLVLCAAFLLILDMASNVPLRHQWRNLSLAIPFIIFPSLALLFTSGPGPAILMVLRIGAAVLALNLLIMTTPLFDLLRTLRWFRIPALISSLLLFTYRFIFVLLDEMDRMKLARRARGYIGRGHLLSREVFRTLSYTAGMVFVRSNKRAANIYEALLSRGYTKEVRTLHQLRVRKRDAVLAGAFSFVALVAVLLQAGVMPWTI